MRVNLQYLLKRVTSAKSEAHPPAGGTTDIQRPEAPNLGPPKGVPQLQQPESASNDTVESARVNAKKAWASDNEKNNNDPSNAENE